VSSTQTFFFLRDLSKIVEHGDVVSNWSLDAFGEAVHSGE
jgi:hypothetical protein